MAFFLALLTLALLSIAIWAFLTYAADSQIVFIISTAVFLLAFVTILFALYYYFLNLIYMNNVLNII